jgi:hypothetical protein
MTDDAREGLEQEHPARPKSKDKSGVEVGCGRMMDPETERTGFEPVVGFNPYTGLANRRYRPLSHLSK